MKFLLTVVVFLVLTLFADAQTENIVIFSGGGVNEPSICINPKNTNNIVAGSNMDDVFVSDDGGLTWNHSHLNSTYGVNGDPSIIADSAGNFYYMHLSYPAFGNWIDRIVCQKSANGGQTWNNGSFMGLNVPKQQDKQWPVYDPVTNRIYVTWTQFDDYGSSDPADSSIILFSYSQDLGQTWSDPMRINRKAGDCLDMDSTVEGAVPAIGPDGEIYVAWAGPDGLVFNKSLDHGQCWMDTNVFISDIPGGWDYAIPGIYRANGLPVTCCDVSNGPYRGNIYVNWSDQRNGSTDTDIWFKKSCDGGTTWSELKRVNDDPPGKQQFFTWMAVDPVTGYIYIVFYDRRDQTGKYTNVYMASSTDGGETFVNHKISTSAFNPSASTFFGDYTNISAYNGVVRPIWTRLDGSVLSLLTAIMDPVLGTAEKPRSMVAMSLEQNYPNPGTDVTYISFKLNDPQFVTLKVFDIYGKEVTTLINNEKLERGKHYQMLDIRRNSLSPGIYFFHLTGDGQTLIRKMTIE